jgi:hypothetical protein
MQICKFSTSSLFSIQSSVLRIRLWTLHFQISMLKQPCMHNFKNYVIGDDMQSWTIWRLLTGHLQRHREDVEQGRANCTCNQNGVQHEITIQGVLGFTSFSFLIFLFFLARLRATTYGIDHSFMINHSLLFTTKWRFEYSLWKLSHDTCSVPQRQNTWSAFQHRTQYYIYSLKRHVFILPHIETWLEDADEIPCQI